MTFAQNLLAIVVWRRSTTPAERTEAGLSAIDTLSSASATGVGYQLRGTRLKALGEQWNGARWRRIQVR